MGVRNYNVPMTLLRMGRLWLDGRQLVSQLLVCKYRRQGSPNVKIATSNGESIDASECLNLRSAARRKSLLLNMLIQKLKDVCLPRGNILIQHAMSVLRC
jgi:hypothetical protein